MSSLVKTSWYKLAPDVCQLRTRLNQSINPYNMLLRQPGVNWSVAKKTMGGTELFECFQKLGCAFIFDVIKKLINIPDSCSCFRCHEVVMTS